MDASPPERGGGPHLVNAPHMQMRSPASAGAAARLPALAVEGPPGSGHTQREGAAGPEREVSTMVDGAPWAGWPAVGVANGARDAEARGANGFEGHEAVLLLRPME